MRIKTYIKQAWALLRQNRLFSALYIVGTGLAVGMTTIMAVIYYVKLAPVYPEVNRFHTYRIASASGAAHSSVVRASPALWWKVTRSTRQSCRSTTVGQMSV